MKKLKLFILCIMGVFFFSTYSFANTPILEEKAREEKTDSISSDEKQIFLAVEQMPSFPGGNEEIAKYLTKSVKYPVKAMEADIQGRVIVSFIVERDGTISNVEIVKSADKYLDAEAVRVVSEMPKWQPGRTLSGKEVRVKFMLPIVFKL